MRSRPAVKPSQRQRNCSMYMSCLSQVGGASSKRYQSYPRWFANIIEGLQLSLSCDSLEQNGPAPCEEVSNSQTFTAALLRCSLLAVFSRLQAFIVMYTMAKLPCTDLLKPHALLSRFTPAAGMPPTNTSPTHPIQQYSTSTVLSISTSPAKKTSARGTRTAPGSLPSREG